MPCSLELSEKQEEEAEEEEEESRGGEAEEGKEKKEEERRREGEGGREERRRRKSSSRLKMKSVVLSPMSLNQNLIAVSAPWRIVTFTKWIWNFSVSTNKVICLIRPSLCLPLREGDLD